MQRVLGNAALRFFARHPWQFVLALAGISLGVAVFVGVQLANDSARRAFELSTSSVRGNTTHRLLPVGTELPESVYVDLVRRPRQGRLAPVIEAPITIARDGSRRTFTLLGIDPIEEIGLRSFTSWAPGDAGSVLELLTEPDSVLVPESLAAEHGLVAGSNLTVDIAGRSTPVTVVGTLASSSANASPPIVADIGTVQELTAMHGLISRIDFALSDAEADELARSAPAGTVLVVAGSEDQQLAQMSDAFTTNLTALALLALVVGMFLIYATISFAVVQRRRSFAVLRSIGLSRRELITGLMVEAAGIGLVGTAAGLTLGHFLASGLVELVLRTMDDLSFTRVLRAATPSPWIYVQGFALGTASTLLSALAPALEAARRDPGTVERRSELELAAKRVSRRAAWLSLPTLVLAVALLLLDTRSLVLAFVALFLVLAAGAMLIPLATTGLMRLLEPLGRGFAGLPATMAIRGVSASLSRTGVATAALAVAVATVISMGLMIGSFRASLITWIDTTLTADMYVLVDDGVASDSIVRSIDELEALPDVAGTSLTHRVILPTRYGELGVRAATPGPEGWGLDFVAGGATADAEGLGDDVVLAEPLAFRLGLNVGDEIELPTAAGPRAFTIAGVARDYNTAGPVIVMALSTYRTFWDDDDVSGIGIHLAGDVDQADTLGRITDILPDGIRPQIRSTELIRELSLIVFDRTFEVTSILRLLAGIVAFLGVLSAILALQLEREREFAVLRSIGMSADELARSVMTQTGLLGFAAGLVSMPLGAVLAWLLVHVINKRSFGWSMEFELAAMPLLQGLALALVAALLAGVYPALLAGRTDLSQALRDE